MNNKRSNSVRVFPTEIPPRWTNDADIEAGTFNNPLKVIVKTQNSHMRQWWCSFASICTFLVPDFCISGNKDAKQAWREKIAILYVVFFTSAFFVGGFGFAPLMICEEETIYTWEDIWQQSKEAWVVVHGGIYDMEDLVHKHPGGIDGILQYLGRDASKLFPRAPPATLSEDCLNMNKIVTPINSTTPVCSDFTEEDILSGFPCHDFATGINGTRKFLGEYERGILAYSGADLEFAHGYWITIYDRVYNVTEYINNIKNKESFLIEDDHANAFLEQTLNSLIINKQNQDATELYETLFVGNNTLNCMNELFYVGIIDTRFNPICFALNIGVYMMLAIVVSVLVLQFLASMRYVSLDHRTFTSSDTEEKIIVMVPCFNEGEKELGKTINSVLKTEYPEENKMILVIADGIITGKGEVSSTPEILAKIFGFEINADDISYEYQSIGEIPCNRARVYSGVYTKSGKNLKYIVIIKSGNRSEQSTSKPGNRGKRDSQLIVMNFLNRVCYNRSLFGLDLKFKAALNQHDFNEKHLHLLMTIDADTRVSKQSISHMVFNMNKNENVMALCGETKVDNKMASWITMIQVFEYYINHHMKKAFESVFGCVTCLPGCFSMYRIIDNDNVPLLVSDNVIQRYACNDIETLHEKSLYFLGEDRLLTVFMILFFPDKQLIFVPEAMCWTIVPHTPKILLSQRRRWTNSTFHNLIELMQVQTMCGICFLSMKTIVFLDLISTMILPASTIYMGYLIYIFITKGITVSMLLIIIFAIIFGVQLAVFVLRSQFQYLWWFFMFVIFGLPMFYVIIPLYSFYNMDTLSWGETRKIRK